MGHALTIITEIRNQIAETPERLDETRRRRDTVRSAAATFPGALRTAGTGSLATALVNRPVDDGDGVVVLDRRSYPTLGPDGDGELPTKVVGEMQEHVGPEVRNTYPDAVVKQMKRGVKVFCHEPFDDEVDPTVDLVVALTRRDGPGLWIPNLDSGQWDASHPERHVDLLNAGSPDLRRSRAQATRVMKAWNTQFSEPALSSFNIAALGLEAITEALPLDEAVAALFEHAATSLAERRTEDPAGVSGPIKLLKEKGVVLKRLNTAATKLRASLDTTDRDEVVDLLASVFWKYVEAPPGSQAALADGLRSGRVGVGRDGLLAVGAGTPLKPTRAFGGRRA